ncbi:MAG: TonB-dependent siderophore receptor [Proteobacteria bacterium]|nr:TonB-dependent siderophore receptor [Pseudomonadota bacterium]
MVTSDRAFVQGHWSGTTVIALASGIAIGLVGLVQPAAQAQEAQPTSPATRQDVPPGQPSVQMPPVTVNASPLTDQDEKTGQTGYITNSITTATKTNTPLIDVPQSVSVITKEFIKDLDITSIEQAVRYVPGVIPHQGESNRDDLVIRGQRSNADFFVNGIRDDVQYFRDLYNLQRLEVLKGPNAMIFGRGGGGGIINRVLKEADGVPIREFTVGGNSYPGFRATGDVGQALSDHFAVRLNGFYEKSNSYRDYVYLERYGINPTATWTPNENTRVKLGFEYLHDWRVTDRGIPSQTRPNGTLPEYPFHTSASTFFGAPNFNYALTDVYIANAVVEHDFGGGLSIRNASQYAYYNKFYQNVFPGGPVSLAGTVPLSAYNNETDRSNLFNQTDLTYRVDTGILRHTLLGGVEIGRQSGLSYRQDGYFNGNPTLSTLTVSAYNPITYGPINFRNIATGANNTYQLDLWALYAQDQVEITKYLQLVGGIRFDRFNFQSQDRRTGAVQGRIDDLVSPRVGVVVKPIENLSIYGSYSVSYLPSAGDQFSTLTPGTAIAQPEKFVNKEVGIKWDIKPRLQFTAAFYDLDRTNQRLPDPSNPGFFILSGATNTKGFEAGISGYITDKWEVMAGYAYTDAKIVGATSATIVPGNRIGLVPYNTFSLWNRYQITPNVGAGLGIIHYDDSFAASDDRVLLSGFTRFDAAVYFRLNDNWRAQLTVENLFNTQYIATADGNNNITPGSPQVFRFSISPKF